MVGHKFEQGKKVGGGLMLLDGETIINAFKIAIRIVKTNQDIIGRQCIRKDYACSKNRR